MRPASGFVGVWQTGAGRGKPPAWSMPEAPLAAGCAWGAAWSAREGQSCWCDAGSFGIAFHGELYNHRELGRELGLEAAPSLALLLSHAWQRWSVQCLQRLDGVFAIAVSDGTGLLLYRDPSGMRNLFCHGPGGAGSPLSFASHLDTLLRLPGVPRRLARRSLHEYLRFLDIAAPNTWFEGVRAVEAGQLLRWSTQGVETATRPDEAGAMDAPASIAAATDLLDHRLRASVRARLAEAKRPAAFLSGGIDSSLLCAMAARERSDVVAVTVGFDTAPFDESPIAQRISAHLGMEHEVLRFDRDQYLQALGSLAHRLEQPMADPATPATVLAYAHCGERYDAVLDGTGADEAVGAMPPRHVRLAVGHASRLPRPLRRGITRLLMASPRLAGLAPIVDFEHPAETLIRWRGFLRPEIEALCGEPVSFADTQFYRTFARFPRRAHFARYSALLDAMPSERLNQAALMSDTPVRFPFWDRTTNHYLRHLEGDFRFRPDEPKRILRQLLARYVPAAVWDLPKHSFDFPLQTFLAADDFALVRRLLDRERWQSGVLQSQAVWQLAQRFIAGERGLVFRVWALVLLGAWLQAHDEPT